VYDYKTLSDFDRCAIRNKIHEFYTVRRQLPTIAKLYESLKDDIKLDGSVSLLLNLASNENVQNHQPASVVHDFSS
jgi:hypothetical protein